MQVFVSKSFSAALMNIPVENMKLIEDKVKILKTMSKTEITSLKEVFILNDKNKDLIVYAYNIHPSRYLLFTFKDKNKLVLFDEFDYISENNVQSLVYPSEFNNKEDNNSN